MPGQTRDKIRALPVGAEVNEDGTEFRVWARGHDRVDVMGESQRFPLQMEGNGYFSGVIPELGTGDTYQYLSFRRQRDFYPTRPRDFSRRVLTGRHR